MLEQIRCQQQKLMMENGLKLHVVGIIDASKAMFSREGFDLAPHFLSLLTFHQIFCRGRLLFDYHFMLFCELCLLFDCFHVVCTVSLINLFQHF